MPKGKYDRHPELKHVEPIRLTIDYEPTPKGRPRIAIHNGKVRGYTPQKTLDAQEFLKSYLTQYKDKMFPPHVPVKLTITFWRTRPYWTKKRETRPCRKPDLNNFLSTFLDGSSKLIFDDDAQVTTVNMSKKWSTNGHGYIEALLEEDRD